MNRQLKLIRQQTEQLWAALKYDVMARGYAQYKKTSRAFGQATSIEDYMSIQNLLKDTMHLPYTLAGLRTSLEHMWGYISKQASAEECARFRELWNQWIESIPSDDSSAGASNANEDPLSYNAVQILTFIKDLSDIYQVAYLSRTFEAGFDALRNL